MGKYDQIMSHNTMRWVPPRIRATMWANESLANLEDRRHGLATCKDVGVDFGADIGRHNGPDLQRDAPRLDAAHHLQAGWERAWESGYCVVELMWQRNSLQRLNIESPRARG
jgi:hypothetical protein